MSAARGRCYAPVELTERLSMPRIQINSDHHLELLELYRLWATELPPAEQIRARTFAERAWEPVADHVEITFEVDDSFVAFLGARRFRYRKV